MTSICSSAPYIELGTGLPFHITTLEELNKPPLMNKVNPELPAGAEFGSSDVTNGAALDGSETTVKGNVFDVPPPGLGVATVIVAELGISTTEASICACNSVLETYSVGALIPFHSTVDSDTKLLPLTVKVNEPTPAITAVGLRAVTEGAGFESRGPNLRDILRSEPDLFPAIPVLGALGANQLFPTDLRYLCGVLTSLPSAPANGLVRT